MSNQKRLMIEIAVALLLILICFSVSSFSTRRFERRLAELEVRHEESLRAIRQEGETRTRQLVAGEAEAVFRAFAAGIQSSVLTQQKSALEIAKGSLLRVPHIAFVHVLAPDGRVLTTSNERFAVAGRADDRASWALEATELRTRAGDLPGTIEIAAPFQGGASGRIAILWLSYKTADLLAEKP